MAKPKESAPPPAPVTTPEEISDDAIRAKIAESAGQLTREQALRILTRHRDRAKAS